MCVGGGEGKGKGGGAEKIVLLLLCIRYLRFRYGSFQSKCSRWVFLLFVKEDKVGHFDCPRCQFQLAGRVCGLLSEYRTSGSPGSFYVTVFLNFPKLNGR